MVGGSGELQQRGVPEEAAAVAARHEEAGTLERRRGAGSSLPLAVEGNMDCSKGAEC